MTQDGLAVMIARRMARDIRVGWLAWQRYRITRFHFRKAALRRSITEWTRRTLVSPSRLRIECAFF